MYAEYLMVAHGETQVAQEMVSIKEKQNLTSLIEVEGTPRYRDNIQSNIKYLGSPLVPDSQLPSKQIKQLL